MLSLKRFNCYIQIPTFKMTTIGQVWQNIKEGDYAFSIDLKDAYLHIFILNIIVIFCILFGTLNITNGRFCHLAGYISSGLYFSY